MKWFYNMKISTKLLSGFILVSIISGIVGTVGYFAMNNIAEKANIIAKNRLVSIDNLWIIMDNITFIKASQRSLLIKDLPAKTINDQINYIPDSLKKIDEAIKVFELLPQSPDEAEKWNAFLPIFNQWKDNTNMELKLFKEIQKYPYNSLEYSKQYGELLKLNTGDHSSTFKLVENQLNGIIAINEKNAKEDSANLDITHTNSINIIFVVIIIGFVVSIVLGLFISRIISSSVKNLATASDKLAIGDLDVNIEANTNDEIGQLAVSFKKMAEGIKQQVNIVERISEGDMTVNLQIRSDKDVMNKKLSELLETNNHIFGDIRNAADQVEAAAGQVAAGSQTMAQGATEQASTVEEVNVSIEEIALQSKENANNSRKANELAVSAKVTATQGMEKMKEMMKSMNEINEASGSISKIIKVIDEIAFQTNILALNAAVEAARAGQHGKGFAVVAEEVRNLAGRSKDAAKETTELIEGTIKKTENGTIIAKDTANALSRIMGTISEVANTIDTISNASNEQAASVSQISQAIGQVADTTQTNSSIAEESAAASEELSSQAQMLKETVSKFKLRKGYST